MAMTRNLEVRAAKASVTEVGTRMGEAGRSGDRDRTRLLAQLAVAERKGDTEAAARIKDSLASETQGKQVD